MPETRTNGELLGEIVHLLKQLAERERIQPRLLRLSEGSRYLHLSPWQLRRIIARGEIAVVKPNDGHVPWLVDRRDLDGWIEKSKVNL